MARRAVAGHTAGKGEGKAVPFSFASEEPHSVSCPSSVALGSSRKSSSAAAASAGGGFRPRYFLQLVALTGFLAALASVFGKLACDFGPHAPLQRLFNHLLKLLLPPHSIANDRLLFVTGEEGCGFEAFDAKPESFVALLQATWRALLMSIYVLPCVASNSSYGSGGASAATVLSFFGLVLLARGCIFGCMLLCNAFMLQCHVKCLVAAPSAGSCSVAIFAANFLCSVALSWLLLDEQLTFLFVAGAACMLSGVTLLSLQISVPTPVALEQRRQ